MRKLLPLLLALLVLLPLAARAERFQLGDRFRITTLSDPQLSPDGKSIAVVSSRPNVAENRHDASLVLVDVADGAMHPLTADRRGVSSPRWSPDGMRLAFLANASSETGAKKQVWMLPMRGGDARRVTDAPRGVQQFAWSADGATIAYETADEAERDPKLDKHNRVFEIGDDDFLIDAAAMPSHVWLIASDGSGSARRLTSGPWSLPTARPPGPAPSPLTWSADGKTIAVTRLANPHSGDTDQANVLMVDVATGTTRALTSRTSNESQPLFSPDGSKIAYWYPLGGMRANQNEIWVASAQGGDPGVAATHALDRDVYRAMWMPDNTTLLVGARDRTGVSLWLQPPSGPARRLDLGDVNPTAAYWVDASVGRDGAIAFTASTPDRPRELYYLASADAKPRRLTDVNHDVAARELGRTERVTWTNEGFSEDG
ncbi:MAG TPA: hypothetical protein VN605_09215, partial [Thermoanaerobaculia bacterium]|nr:hypothetical protein [Thermoanaerobaculia bacterium]